MLGGRLPCALGLLLSVCVCVSGAPDNRAKSQRPVAGGAARDSKPMFDADWQRLGDVRDVRTLISRYDRIVPVIGPRDGFVEKRREMFAAGVYPGVEYRVSEIIVRRAGRQDESVSSLRTAQASDDEVLLLLRPAYPLVARLERVWPVEFPLSSIPVVLTRGAYNSATVLGSGGLAGAFLLAAVLLSNAFTLSAVNSRSMEPTIMPRDVILVEKISPVVRRLLRLDFAPGSVVFFRPPEAFETYLRDRGIPPISDNALVVKRVQAADPACASQGAGARGGACVTVRGDNADASLDSRFWGSLPVTNIVGHPLLRVLPLHRAGPL